MIRRHRALATTALVVVLTAAVVAPSLAGFVSSAGASTITQTFGFDNDTLQHFTVPADVTSLTITALGGQGSWGGRDSAGRPPAGGYQGEVTGTISVTPGEYLTIGVGSGADQSPDANSCTGGQDASTPNDSNDAVPGINPLTQFDGGAGGAPGPNGCSGYGGAGGAATAVELGSSASSPTSVGTIVAGGGGGSGGSGQYGLVVGQISLPNYTAPSTPSPITYGIPAGCSGSGCSSTPTIESPSPLPSQPTQGQQGIAVFTECGGSTGGNNADQYFQTGAPNDEAGCDGGGGAGGGGGAAGGSAGNLQFGSGSSDEWYGLGGSPGENSTGGIAGLSASDPYYTDSDGASSGSGNTFADPGATYDGEVQITYSSGTPGIPTGVSGTAGNASVALQWTAPSPGAQPISDYIIQYSSNGGSTWTTDDTHATATSATVTGLTNGTGYIFEVEAVNSVGNGSFTAPSGTLTPTGPPAAPTITSITPLDGALQVAFTPPGSGTITGYQYQLDGTGPWVPVATTTSPLTISGLTDGTTYSVELEAISGSQTGAASNSMSGTPVAVPGAPTISVAQVGSTTASINVAPGNTGGSTVTGYRYSTNGGTTWTTTSATSPLSLTGLTPGTTYTVEVEAGNTSGYGAAATTSFTTTAAPSAPVITSITPGNQTLTVGFTAPASGGAPITDYQFSTDGGATFFSESTEGTPCQVTNGTSVTCVISDLSTNGTTALTNGTPYPIEVEAVNAVGAGGASSPVSGTPYTTPGAPTITTGSSGMQASNQSLTVSFTAPTSNGGSVITGYQYSTDAGATWHNRTDNQSATSTTMTITALSTDGATALTNGTVYDVEIRAVNAAGDGPGSAVATGIPVYVPTAPTITAVTPENGALGVAFTPGSNGGSAVTEYDYSTDNGVTWTSTGTLSPSFTITGLANGTSYPVEVRADNSLGDSAASTPVSGTPATVPAQPVITSTTRGNATITVAFTDASNGGSAVTQVQYSTDAGATWQTASSTSSPLTITTLSTNGTTPIANGTEYPVEIREVNGVGDSPASAPAEAQPAAAPGAPTVVLTPGNGVIAVAATVTNNGGSSITGIDYSLDDSTWVSTGTTSTTFTIPNLTNGQSYTVWVRADNAIGNGAASSPASATPFTVPGAPTGVGGSDGSGSWVATWSAPASNGGSVITHYTATAYTSAAGTTTAGTACTTSGALTCTVTGLTNGTTYYIGVVATNAAGNGPPSSPLLPVTPIALPGAPTITSITPGNTVLAVNFTAGSSGGDAITSYQYSLNGGSTWTAVSSTSSPIYISGLTNGTSYPVTIEAVSAAGTGATSNSVSQTPYTTPDAPNPASITTSASGTSIVVNWAAPDTNGGAPIANATVDGVSDAAYTVTAFNSQTGGTQEATCTTSGALSCTLTNLAGNTNYWISIQAGNAAGLSQRSSPRVETALLTITSPALRGGDQGVSYSAQPTENGGTAPYTWSVSSGSLPAGLSISSTTGAVTGTPTATGTSTFTLQVEDHNNWVATQSESVTIGLPPTISSSPLGGGDVGRAYTGTPTVSGGTSPFTWSVSSGSLPAGLSLASTTGAVTGTPTAPGTATFTLEVTDANGVAATQAESVAIASALQITSSPWVNGEVGVSYPNGTTPVTATATGGTGTDTWSVSTGSLPGGLVLNPSTGAISGAPSSAGPASFTLEVTDSVGGTATQSESFTIVADPVITSSALPGGDTGVSYSAVPTTTGGTSPLAWSLSTGSLPAGLSLSSTTGAVTGTPTVTGTFPFTLEVTDADGQVATQAESVTVLDDLAITSAPLGNGEVGVSYPNGTGPATATAVNGTGSDTWSIAAGSLPIGLTLNASTGTVSGVPTTAGPVTFTLEVTDSGGTSATQAESFTIIADPVITSSVLTGADAGAPYAATPTMTGGISPLTWSVPSGSLPAGLHLNPSTGAVTGTPTVTGPVSFTLEVTDADGQVATQVESFTLAAPPTTTGSTTMDGNVGVPVGRQLATQGGTGPYDWTLSSGSLPGGVALSSSGMVSGVPGAAGTFVATVTVTDAHGLASSEALTIVVLPTSLNSRRMAVTPDGKGYWLASTGGGVSAYGDATPYGSMAGRALNQPIMGIAATADGKGYWLAASDGGIFSFGDASFFGSEGDKRLNQPIVGMAATPDGKGYWLAASDGGVFTFGDAPFLGAQAGHRLNAPVESIEGTQDGGGYWLVANDGGVFTFGDAGFLGADPGRPA